MVSKPSIITAGMSRVWLLEWGPAIDKEPQYMGLMKIDDSSWPAGDTEDIKIPDPSRKNSFVKAAQIKTGEERVSLSLTGRYPKILSKMLELRRRGCRVDIHIPFGKCGNPQDYHDWDKMRVYRDGEISSWGDEAAGALDDDERAATNETGEFTADELYELAKPDFAEVGASEAAREVVAIEFCDSIDCGECGAISNGCEKVFAVMLGTGITPGTKPSVLFSEDGGDTWVATDLDTMYSSEDPSDIICVGKYVVVPAADSHSVHYANKQDILDEVETWYENDGGFIAGSGPNAAFSVDAMHTWLVGQGGYIYFASDITSDVTVQDAGVATTQNLLSVHALDSDNILAGGELNAIVHSSNGGETWQAVTGPAPGESIRSVWMISDEIWLVGTNNGSLYYTKDAGTNWTEKSLPGSVDNIDAIRFVDDTVGYIAARQGTRGYILRTTCGGNMWYIMPWNGVAIPANDYINDIAPCEYDHNLVIGAGLADDATSGFMVKAE